MNKEGMINMHMGDLKIGGRSWGVQSNQFTEENLVELRKGHLNRRISEIAGKTESYLIDILIEQEVAEDLLEDLLEGVLSKIICDLSDKEKFTKYLEGVKQIETRKRERYLNKIIKEEEEKADKCNFLQGVRSWIAAFCGR